MKLLLVRHAAAVRRGTSGIGDDERPLTPRGRAKLQVAARGLAQITERPDVLLTSPLSRARATAEISAAAFKKVTPRIEPALARGDVDAMVDALTKYPPDSLVALVGHEPSLSQLLGRLLEMTHGTDRFVFKKGGAALVDLPDGPAAAGRLCWFVKPRTLRSLGDD
jgi:phosphohistidine phosphatase